MRYLTIEEVLVLHAYQIDTFGGNSKILDIKLLESALSRPQTILSNKEMFPTLYDKAVVLVTGIINNHPFVDGNKRAGLHAMLVFLELNDTKILIDNKELVKLGNDIAKKVYSTKEVAKYLKENTSQHLPR
jgi:death on curing protein